MISKCPVCKNNFCDNCQGYVFAKLGNSQENDINKIADFYQVDKGILVCEDCIEGDTFGSWVAVIKQMAEIVTKSGKYDVEVKFEQKRNRR